MQGIDAVGCEVEADVVASNEPETKLVGLADAAVRVEAKRRSAVAEERLADSETGGNRGKPGTVNYFLVPHCPSPCRGGRGLFSGNVLHEGYAKALRGHMYGNDEELRRAEQEVGAAERVGVRFVILYCNWCWGVLRLGRLAKRPRKNAQNPHIGEMHIR